MNSRIPQPNPAGHGQDSDPGNRRSGSTRLLCALALACCLAHDAIGAAPVTNSVTGSGRFTGSWDQLDSPLPTADGAVKTYSATAVAGAAADGVPGPLSGTVVKGIKLTYTSAGISTGLPQGTFTPSTVKADDAVAGPLGSIAFGEITITGSHPARSTYSATVGGSAFVKAAAVGGASASFTGTVADPYSFSMPDFSPIPAGTLLDFALTLSATENIFPVMGSPAAWSMTYSSAIKDIETSDVDVFLAASPDLLYSLTLSGGPAGYAVDFVAGSPAGFGVTFSDTEAGIEADMLAALTGGWVGDLTIVSGSVDVSGHTAVSIGNRGEINMEDTGTGVPEHASTLLLLTCGGAVLLAGKRWRRPAAD